jgi:hypothetical protein
VGVGSDGEVSFTSTAQTDLVVDLEGYTSPTALNGAGLYDPLTSPSRICDTRAVSSFTRSNPCNQAPNVGRTDKINGTIDVPVTNGDSIPDNAAAAVLNVTVVNPTASGYVTVFPQGVTEPNASNVNYVAGQVATNRVIVPLSASGKITVANSAPTDVIIDVSGYYTASGGIGSQFSAEPAPARICDTRAVSTFSPSNQCSGLPIGPGETQAIQVSGLAGVPADATAVVVNLTGIVPTQPTYLAVFPGPDTPNSSDLNPAAGQVRANLVVATVNPNTGKISIFNADGTINAVVDVLGWYS